MIFRKLLHRWRRWIEWNDYAKEKYGLVKRFLIFLGIVHNEWFETFADWRNRTWENGTEIRFDD